MTGRRRKRVFIVKIPPLARADFDKFMERLSKAVAGDPVLMRLQGDKLRIEVYGGEVLARRTVINVRRVIREFTVSRAPSGRGARRLPREAINRAAGVAVPLDVLEEVLRIRGFEAEASGDYLVTNADAGEVERAASEVARMLSEAAGLPATRTAKKAIVAAGAASGASLVDVVDAGLSLGVLDEDLEGKLHVVGDWREASKRVARSLLGEGD